MRSIFKFLFVALLVLFTACTGGSKASKPVDADVIMGRTEKGVTYYHKDGDRIAAVNIAEDKSKATRIEILPNTVRELGEISMSQIQLTQDGSLLTILNENQIYQQQPATPSKVAKNEFQLPEKLIENLCISSDFELRVYKSDAGYQLIKVAGSQSQPLSPDLFLRSEIDQEITFLLTSQAGLHIKKNEASASDSSYFKSNVVSGGVLDSMWDSISDLVCHLNLPQSISVANSVGVSQMTQKAPKAPLSANDDNSIGTISWATPTRALASDNLTAQATGYGTTHYLKLTDFFGADPIPTGSKINGITVEIDTFKGGLDGGGLVKTNSVFLVKSGVIGGTNHATTASIGLANSTQTLGGDADLWGSTWTDTDLNGSGFGVAISYDISNGMTFIGVDQVRVKVSYTPPTTKGITIATGNRALTINGGSTQTLSWTSTGGISSVNLLLSTDGGTTFPTVIANSIVNTGSYNWTVPQWNKSNVRIQVQDASNSAVYDMSDFNAKINTIPSTDSFTNGIDSNYWIGSVDASYSSGKVFVSHTPMGSTMGLWSRFFRSGDFDVSVNYSGLNLPACSFGAIGFMAITDSGNYNVERRTGNMLYTDGAGPAGIVDATTSGIFRIQRVGTSITVFKSDGVTPFSTVTGTTNDAIFLLYGRDDAVATGCNATGYFDDFVNQ